MDNIKDEIKTEPKQDSEASTSQTDQETTNDEIKSEKDPLLDSFYSEIDNIKSEDFKSSSKEQIERLLRPGSTYFNLNPFEVLQIDPYASIDEIKKKYKKLSIYVHPDKNPNDKERAQIAFEAVNRAYKLLENEADRKKCLEVVDEAREKVDTMCEEKRKKLRREIHLKQMKSKKKDQKEDEEENVKIEEDDPDKYRHAIYVMTCKLFADIERLKVREGEKQAEEKKRKAEEKVEEESKAKIQKEWDKNYEDTRENRISSWKNFVSKKGGVVSIPSKGFKPPKHKPETR